MIIRYSIYDKKKRNNYINSLYLKSIEICCPEMSFHILHERLIMIQQGDLELCDNGWPICFSIQGDTRGITPIAMDFNFCHKCGEQFIVYVEDKKCLNAEDIDKAIKAFNLKKDPEEE